MGARPSDSCRQLQVHLKFMTLPSPFLYSLGNYVRKNYVKFTKNYDLYALQKYLKI